ncbi:GNAT family N-acetyltransferase [Halomonas huangheensis]|uniref:N-acetyltransferase domain-containing protein n=1 Tax=Halomonas huangheensis TaxID=1178482 RepID=W1ND87_9GAMM|nr:GNAT family N-acetyltransferase [Halomonas huangheensis]ALM52974.1 hypothetical protein AR456_12265 [Halomonas huangheensis]ERL53100.1 hypothetical protein BJB45_17650 [Halomonas huangheensis]
MAYTIHRIQRTDADDWLRLRNQLWEADDHQQEIEQFFRGELDEPLEVLIARDQQGRAAGHVELSIRTDIPGLEGVRTGYIEGLYIVTQHRGSGLTRQLLRASEEWAVAQGCEALATDRADRVIVYRRFGVTGY